MADEEPITARTIVDSWLRTLDPSTGAEYAYMITMLVKGASAYNEGKADAESVQIRALDERTFQADLIGPMPYAVDMIAHHAFAILPMHAIRRYGKAWTDPGKLVTNGPYSLGAWERHRSLIAVRNERYWDSSSVELDSIVFLPTRDFRTAYNTYAQGGIDWLKGVPLDQLHEIGRRPDYQAHTTIATYYYVFNMTRPPFTDLRVRKALAMAIDKQALVRDVTRGGQVPTDALVPPLEGYDPPAGIAYAPEDARRLLGEAGYPGGDGFPSVTLIYNTHDTHRRIAEYVAESWKRELGIEIRLRNMEWKAFLSTRFNHDFDIARSGWVGDYLDPNTFLDMFLREAGNNDGLYGSDPYDDLVLQAAGMPQGEARADALEAAEALLIQKDAAIIPLYYYVEQDLIDLSLWEGWYPNALGVHPWKFIRRAVRRTSDSVALAP